jgi:hypothetical protein
VGFVNLVLHSRQKRPLIQDDSLKRGEFAPRSFITPQICADDRRLDRPGEKAHLVAKTRRRGEQPKLENNWAANGRKEMRIALVAEVRAVAERRGWAHAPPELLRAA